MIIQNLTIPLIVVIISFLSYNYNFLGAANNSWFRTHDLHSEQLVLDGILNGLDKDNSNGSDFRLGSYSRPGLSDPTSDPYNLLSHDLYQEGNRLGSFSLYRSQYGLQVRLFGLAAKLGYGDVGLLQGLSALLMSLIVGILFWLVRRDFSFASALAFSLALIVSPWVIVFAKNLYWVPVTWFLPLAVSMYFSNKIFTSSTSMIAMVISLFLSFLVKFLCGYEYITTIFIASFVPILYQGLKSKIPLIKISKIFFLTLLIFIISLSTAMGIHIKSNFESIPSGIDFLIEKSASRTYSTDPDTFENPRIRDSLNSNGLMVVARYMTTFYDFLPWLPSIRDISVLENDKDIKILKEVYSKPSLRTLQDSVFKTSNYLKFALLSVIISSLSFLVLIGFIFRLWFKIGFPLKAVILISSIAPISWFFLAKAHSYIHYQLNYVLWYLPFIPYSLAILVENFINRKNRRLKAL
jgi:hypothetical protein